MSNLDLNSLPPDIQVALTKKESDGERRVRLGKDIVVFTFAVVVLILAVIWSGWITIEPAADPGDKSTAKTILTAIIGGLLGYLLKK